MMERLNSILGDLVYKNVIADFKCNRISFDKVDIVIYHYINNVKMYIKFSKVDRFIYYEEEFINHIIEQMSNNYKTYLSSRL